MSRRGTLCRSLISVTSGSMATASLNVDDDVLAGGVGPRAQEDRRGVVEVLGAHQLRREHKDAQRDQRTDRDARGVAAPH